MAPSEEKQDGIVETIKTVVYALVIAIVFRAFFFQPFYIPSGSMKDTLLVGDFLFVNKMAYGYSSYSCEIPLVKAYFCPFIGDRLFARQPERGDVVVFIHPTTGQDYIKRLIGLPGDTVQMRDGKLVLNGKLQPQTPDGDFVEVFERQGGQGRRPRCFADAGVLPGGDCVKPRFTEELDDHGPIKVLNILDNGQGDNTDIFTVPEGHFFFIGDNRDNSVDSRFPQIGGGVGMVPFANLLGRADRVMFSSGGRRMLFFWSWRGDRFFKAIE